MSMKRRYTKLVAGFGDDLQGYSIEARLVVYELATTRLRTTIPGVIHGGSAGFAETTGLDEGLVRRCLDELDGVVYRDTKKPLMFMPRCVQQDSADNPNVLKAWSSALDELPDCELVSIIERTIAESLSSEAMRDAWNGLRNGLRNGSGNGSANGSGNGMPNPIPKPIPIPSTDTDTHTDFERVRIAYPKQKDRPNALKAFMALNPDAALVKRILAAIEAHKQSAQWQSEGGRYVPNLAKWLEHEGWNDEPGPPLYADNLPVVERCDVCGDLHGLMDDCKPLCADCRQRHLGQCWTTKMRIDEERINAENAAAAAEHGLTVEEFLKRTRQAAFGDRFGVAVARTQ